MEKLVNYVKSAIAEMKKVTWPTKKETTQYTILVVIISLGIAALLGGLDYIFSLGVQAILTRQLF